MSNIQVQSITFMDDGLVVTYMDVDTDIRVEGKVVRSSQLSVSAKHPDYRDDIEGLHARVVRVLKNALEDFEESDPVNPDDARPPSQDEQELGMGHG